MSGIGKLLGFVKIFADANEKEDCPYTDVVNDNMAALPKKMAPVSMEQVFASHAKPAPLHKFAPPADYEVIPSEAAPKKMGGLMGGIQKFAGMGLFRP